MFGALARCSVGALIVALSSSWASARSLTDLEAVHQAATQRTLVMRIANAYVQMAHSKDKVNAQQTLANVVDQYAKNLAELEANSPNSRLNQRIVAMKSSWQTFSTLIKRTPAPDAIVAVLEESDQLLFQNDALTRQWRLRLPQDCGQLNELALQQGMLSERIGLLYSALQYGVKEPWVAEEMQLTMSAYDQGLRALNTAVRHEHDQQLLAQLQTQWQIVRSDLQSSQRTSGAVLAGMQSMYVNSQRLGDALRDEELVALNARTVNRSLAANVNVE